VDLIHRCYRITVPERSIAFYKALGFEKRRELPIRDEAVNDFLGLPGDGDRLEITYNFHTQDGGYEVGTDSGHIAFTVDDLDVTLGHRWTSAASRPSARPTRCARAADVFASCGIRTATGSS
jgi:lactoylglutathione lyase